MQTTDVGSIDIEALPPQIREQLALLDETERNLFLILTGILMRFKIVDIQRQSILAQGSASDETHIAGCLDPFAMQVTASVITLYALFGFQSQARQIASQTRASGADSCPAEVEETMALIVIIVALIRFALLLDTNDAHDAQTQQEALPENDTLLLETDFDE